MTSTRSVLIEGLPGIGNVGKVVVDFLVEKTGAQPVAQFLSQTLPNSVFINEDNLVELPKILLYHSRFKGTDYLFLTGDVQPTDEVSSYQFCELLIKKAKEWNVKKMITLGGIGLQEAPQEPLVYSTGNDETFIADFVSAGTNPNVYGIVGPIIGVTGLLLGLAQQQKIPAVALLAETLGHPMYLGLRGAKSVLQILKETLALDFNLEDLDEEILNMEAEEDMAKPNPKIDAINRLKRYRDTNYIG